MSQPGPTSTSDPYPTPATPDPTPVVPDPTPVIPTPGYPTPGAGDLPGGTTASGSAAGTGGGSTADPSAKPSPPEELPLRGSETVQGNVLAAFLQDHQTFRLVTLPADPDSARGWLTDMVPLIAVTADVETSNEAYSRARKADRDLAPAACWVGLSLTVAGLETLAGDSSTVRSEQPKLPEHNR